MADPVKVNNPEQVRVSVREHYARAAQGSGCGCGDSASKLSILDGPTNTTQQSCCGGEKEVEFANVAALYAAEDVQDLPEEVTNISLGCGDPVTLASLQPGQTVLDLGSGGGIDCFLAAKKVGKTGHVIGVDMTPAMIDRARENRTRLGADNVEFRLGEIEHLPVGDNTVDVVISNCVINLSPDKPQVFQEAFRVLKPGGKLSVSDIVTDGPLPDKIKQDLSSWAGCVAGAWDARDYMDAIGDAGFENINLEPEYMDEAVLAAAAEQLDLKEVVELHPGAYQRTIFSAKVTAYKPIH